MVEPLPILPRCVLFDLDGTLLDTAADMGRALNRLLQEQKRPQLPLAKIRPEVSHGSRGLLALGFNLSPRDAQYEILRQRYLDIYSAALAVDTKLFPSMEKVLMWLERRRIPWGIVTNKPGWLTEPLVTAMGLAERAACVVSGDTTERTKPDPQPLLHACKLVNVAPASCLYVGDAERDVEAAQRAGMAVLVARYGYLYAYEKPEDWGAHGVIDSPEALLDWLE